MIYEVPAADAPIKQGDIFVRLPRLDFSLDGLTVVDRDDPSEPEVVPWQELLEDGKQLVTALVAMRPVTAMVITQDCDASRSGLITFCEIREFSEVVNEGKDVTSAKRRMQLITQQAKKNQKYFYLPPDPAIGFDRNMAVDYRVTLSVRRSDLEALRTLRKGRLNGLAEEHFRERISEFFRRYPYDEWYPLSADELAAYQANIPDADIKPFPWQVAP